MKNFLQKVLFFSNGGRNNKQKLKCELWETPLRHGIRRATSPRGEANKVSTGLRRPVEIGKYRHPVFLVYARHTAKV